MRVMTPLKWNTLYRVHSACPSVSFTILSPPDVNRHISTSLPAGTGLAQVICGLLSYLVVENLQVTIQEASRSSEFVIRMLAISSPGKMVQLNGTNSADAGVDSRPLSNVRPQKADRMKGAEAIFLPLSSARH
jgi:hypothetical protein